MLSSEVFDELLKIIELPENCESLTLKLEAGEKAELTAICRATTDCFSSKKEQKFEIIFKD